MSSRHPDRRRCVLRFGGVGGRSPQRKLPLRYPPYAGFVLELACTGRCAMRHSEAAFRISKVSPVSESNQSKSAKPTRPLALPQRTRHGGGKGATRSPVEHGGCYRPRFEEYYTYVGSAAALLELLTLGPQNQSCALIMTVDSCVDSQVSIRCLGKGAQNDLSWRAQRHAAIEEGRASVVQRHALIGFGTCGFSSRDST